MSKHVDLTLIKKLVSELDSLNTSVENLIENKTDPITIQLEIAKSLGLSLAMAQEAELLSADFKKLMEVVASPDLANKVKLTSISAEDLFNAVGLSRKKTNQN